MAKGNPLVCFGLEPEVIELLRQRVEPAKGRAGGVALLMRRLVYEYLGLPMPVQYGDLGRSSAKRKRTGRGPGRPRKKSEEELAGKPRDLETGVAQRAGKQSKTK